MTNSLLATFARRPAGASVYVETSIVSYLNAVPSRDLMPAAQEA